MAEQKRTSASVSGQSDIGSGPYLARVISHLDPSFNGSLEVTILRDQANQLGNDTETYVVRCATPFFGYTPYEMMGQNDGTKKTIDGFNDTQKSYGMWFVPPDTGVTVIVVFINGDPAQGYWIGCVPPKFANHMVPAIAGSDKVSLDDADKKKYNTKQPLPVAEVNRKLNGKNDQQIDVEKIKKPVHPIADVFLTQGLIEDDVRGTTTSTGRREAPSMVFGISTPGPLDRRAGAKKGTIGTLESKTGPVPVSRLGGTTFVMDDGDDRYQRKKPANAGPVEYANVLKGEKGDPTIPYNEYFRVRTRTGHQILLHNSEDLIYISNSKGTTWIELTSNGKIDIFAEDSVSIHTKNDLNFYADRDINLEAGRNFNVKAAGLVHTESGGNTEILVGASGLITTKSNLDIKTTGNNKISSSGTFDIFSNGSLKIKGSSIDIKSSGEIKNESGGVFSAKASSVNLDGSSVNLNGGGASGAATASEASATTALKTYKNPVTDKSLDWAKTKYQKKEMLESIMRRVPMHEPWALHENQAPTQLTPDNTDRGEERSE